MTEIWKDIQGYEGLYQVSNFGRIKALHKVVSHKYAGTKTIPECIKKIQKNLNGYSIIVLSINNKPKTFTVHRLVAKHFIHNPENKPEVNHIDGDKGNNHISNLEWNTKSENNQHAYNNGLKKGSTHLKGKTGSLCFNSIPVLQILSNGKEIKFASATEAEKNIGISRRGISQCARGIQSFAGGHKWKYA